MLLIDLLIDVLSILIDRKKVQILAGIKFFMSDLFGISGGEISNLSFRIILES
jgi:hypothetical protein